MGDDLRQYSYKLVLGAKINETDNRGELTLIQSTVSISIGGRACSICLNGVKFTRKIYEPGLIEAEVIIEKQASATALPALDTVKELFIKRQTKLIIIKESTPETIAENYYVYQVNPVLVSNNGKTSLSVKLTIYSLDKLMTINKGSNVFIAKKLAEEILKPVSKDFGFTDDMLQADIGYLKHLIYFSGIQIEEMIQPYLVQYNESFYDFMVRTANRCGEFLYFEEGKLTLGIKSVFNSINAYESVTLQEFSDFGTDINSYARDAVKDDENIKGFNADSIDKDISGYPADAFPISESYNAELTHDDLIFPMKKDNFTSFDNELGINYKNMLVNVAKKVTSNTSGYCGIPEIIRSLGTNIASSALNAVKTNNKTNQKGQKDYIDIFEKDSLQTNGTTSVQFATVLKDGWPTLDFYCNIRRHEEEQHKKMVCIDMGQTYKSVKLGESISIKGVDGTYIVTQIELRSNDPWERNYSKFEGDSRSDIYTGAQSQIIWAIPVYTDADNTDADNQEIIFPPVAPVPIIRKSGPQTAFVTDSADPKKQGRVRIAYPWQADSSGKHQELLKAQDDLAKAEQDLKNAIENLKKLKEKGMDTKAAENTVKEANTAVENAKDDVENKAKPWKKQLGKMGSPWIRVVSPMATDGGGAYFLPNPGDEVLVNYDNDNIERPYVVGSVYSKNLNEPNSGHGGAITLQSPNGQFITLSSAGGSKFLESIAPILKPISTIEGPKNDDGSKKAEGPKEAFSKIDKEIGGGITMSDTFGMFKIDMSSHGRKIDIESPFGKVGISAFTGITVNAPNGDIKISGKNVTIEAGNNLTLKSGTNVNYNDFSLGETIKNMVKDTVNEGIEMVANLGDAGMVAGVKIVDCALIRCVVDTFLKPIEGTLCIKSNNYLMLEAGKGKAEVPLERYSASWQDYKKAEKDGDKQIFYSKTTAYAKRLDEKLNNFCSSYKKAKEKAFLWKSNYNLVVKSIVLDANVSNLQDIRTDAFKLADGAFVKYDANNLGQETVKSSESFKAGNLKPKPASGYKIPGKGAITTIKDAQDLARNAAEGYAEAIYNLQRIVQSVQTVITDDVVKAVNKAVLGTTEDDHTKWIDDIFKTEAAALLKKLHDDWEALYGSRANGPTDRFLSEADSKASDDPFTDTKLEKRMAMARMLRKLYLAAENFNGKEFGKYIHLADKAKTDPSEEYVKKDWDEIAALGNKEYSIIKLIDFLTDVLNIQKTWKPLIDVNAPMLGWAQKVWNDKSGQIIFSNKKGTTYALSGEEIEKFEYRKEHNIKSLKDTLLKFGE